MQISIPKSLLAVALAGFCHLSSAAWHELQLNAPEQLHEAGKSFTSYDAYPVKVTPLGVRLTEIAELSPGDVEEIKRQGVFVQMESKAVTAAVEAALLAGGVRVVDDRSQAQVIVRETRPTEYVTQWPRAQVTKYRLDSRFDSGMATGRAPFQRSITSHLVDIAVPAIRGDLVLAAVSALEATTDVTGVDEAVIRSAQNKSGRAEEFQFIGDCYERSSRQAKSSCNQASRDTFYLTKIRIQAVILGITIDFKNRPEASAMVVARRIDNREYTGVDALELSGIAAAALAEELLGN